MFDTAKVTLQVKKELIKRGALTDPDSTKGELLAVAAHLFREQGYERTTVRDLGRHAGILPGSIFHHFGSKDEILRTVMRESINLNLARIHATLPEAHSIEDELRTLIRWELYANHGETGEAWSVLVNEWRSLSAEGQEEMLKLRREYDGLWISALNRASNAGLVALQPRVLRRLLAGALHWTPYWFRPEKGLSFDELTEEVLRLILITHPPTTQPVNTSTPFRTVLASTSPAHRELGSGRPPHRLALVHRTEHQ